MAQFSRKQDISRMIFKGMKVNVAPDALPEYKYAFAQNVRGYLDDQITARAQWTDLYAAPVLGGGPVTMLEPTLGIYKILNAIWLQDQNIDTGFESGTGCAMIPFRPNESPSAWEYIFDGFQQVKVLPNTVTPTSSIIKKVGIAEPQTPCDAAIEAEFSSLFNVGAGASAWSNVGTASAPANGARLTDSVINVFADPASSGLWTIQVLPSNQYQRNMTIFITQGSTPIPYHVLDVFPVAPTGIAVAAIYYYAGTTGHCVVVPQNIQSGPGDAGIGISQQQLLASLRRGSLIQFGTSEVCYVLSVTDGPDGTVCIETSTTAHHAAGELLTAPPAIQVIGGLVTSGQAITSPDITFSVSSGIGSEAIPFPSSQFIYSNFSFQDKDYIHLSIQIDNPLNLIACRLGFDVSDGTFTKDYYYYEIRPSDLQGALTGVSATQLTQLAAAQLLGQRSKIDAVNEAAFNNEIFSTSGSQLLVAGGNPLWTEIIFPISAMTRVGSDNTKTIANCVEFDFSVNCSGTVNMAINGLAVFGGYSPDVDVSIPYQYRYRARDSQTGAASNFSPVMRYGTSPRRSLVNVVLPGSYPDTQADTFDIERMGGALEDWTYIGSILIGAGDFMDSYSDESVANNDELPEDNYEPFPTIGPPLSTTGAGANITGYVATLKFTTPSTNPSLSAILNLLPGNLLQIGQQVYTTYSRPTFVSSGGGTITYIVYLVENSGNITFTQATILEPLLANKVLANVWGPDDNGCLFACGDDIRPGVVYNTNPQNPDGCNEGVNANELCAPTEPLINGALIQQTSCVASPNRWWAGRSGQDAAGNLKYNWIEIPVGRGLAAPYGVCTDGENIYFVGKDGIYKHSGGPATSLTDEDLYPLFPHEGTQPGEVPTNITYDSETIYAPAYQYAQNFRLAVVNRFLYFDYQDSTGAYHTLTCNLRTMAWCIDTFFTLGDTITIHAGIQSPVSPSSGNITPQLYGGDAEGGIYITSNSGTASEEVECVLCTREEIGDDVRAMKLFGDAAVDVYVASVADNVVIRPVVFGAVSGFSTTLTAVGRQPGTPVDLGGELLGQSLGLRFDWTTAASANSAILYSWQVSWVPQPENTIGRFTDWEGNPDGRNLFYQGFELEADTNNVARTIFVRDADTLAAHPFNSPTGGTNTVQHNGQQRLPYSFVTPFQAHLVRLEPQDTSIWRMYGIRWITRPTPDSALNWITQSTSYGIKGYHHVHHAIFAYASTATVTLSIITDGVTSNYTLPSTAGAYKKVIIMFNPVKGLVDAWSAISTAAFQVWNDDIEIYVKGWGDPSPYKNAHLIGAEMGATVDV